MICGSKAELIDRVPTHARGNLSARGVAEHEDSPKSCDDDTSSESRDSDDSLIYVEEPFHVMFEGSGVAVILPFCVGGSVKSNFS